MVNLERYERIREGLKMKAVAIAQKYSIRFGGLNSFSDITINTNGPSLKQMGLDEEFLNRNDNPRIFLGSLWALRKYLRIIEKYPDYRNAESQNSSEVIPAFPDIQKAQEYDGLQYYVWESAKRLEQQITSKA